MTGERLVSLVYSSTGTRDFSELELEELLTRARDFNRENEVTGMLLYRAGRFVQFLEGPESRVAALMASITADPRHRDVRVLLDDFPDHRQFAEWTMGYQRVAEPTTPLPEGFRNSFDDLEQGDPDAMLRAVRELSLWFRVRTADEDD